jgi:hypothetical protein
VALGMLIERADLYLLIAAASLFLLMAVPGFGMMRQALRTSAA